MDIEGTVMSRLDKAGLVFRKSTRKTCSFLSVRLEVGCC